MGRFRKRLPDDERLKFFFEFILVLWNLRISFLFWKGILSGKKFRRRDFIFFFCKSFVWFSVNYGAWLSFIQRFYHFPTLFNSRQNLHLVFTTNAFWAHLTIFRQILLAFLFDLFVSCFNCMYFLLNIPQTLTHVQILFTVNFLCFPWIFWGLYSIIRLVFLWFPGFFCQIKPFKHDEASKQNKSSNN